jgi:hypothetical protein
MADKFKSGISIVVMAHHRQKETIRAVNAILDIDFGCDTEIVVSDNPSTPEKTIFGLPSSVIHKVRNPAGDSLWHVNEILKELSHDWTLLTHDDDEMLPHLGDLFRKYCKNPEVAMITGKSRILVNNIETKDKGYLMRLEKSGLLSAKPVLRSDLFASLFDIGPLFPASAMIVRSEHLRSISNINPDYNLAGDLAYSMAIANQALVVFDGNEYAMNYHIHGGNSVFSTAAAGGLMSDFTIVRLNEAVKNNLPITKSRQRMLNKAVLVSRILAKSFHLTNRYRNVKLYSEKFSEHFPSSPISRFLLLPLPLGPMKFIVRRMMWKRLGVNKWGC